MEAPVSVSNALTIYAFLPITLPTAANGQNSLNTTFCRAHFASLIGIPFVSVKLHSCECPEEKGGNNEPRFGKNSASILDGEAPLVMISVDLLENVGQLSRGG